MDWSAPETFEISPYNETFSKNRYPTLFCMKIILKPKLATFIKFRGRTTHFKTEMVNNFLKLRSPWMIDFSTPTVNFFTNLHPTRLCWIWPNRLNHKHQKLQLPDSESKSHGNWFSFLCINSQRPPIQDVATWKGMKKICLIFRKGGAGPTMRKNRESVLATTHSPKYSIGVFLS